VRREAAGAAHADDVSASATQRLLRAGASSVPQMATVPCSRGCESSWLALERLPEQLLLRELLPLAHARHASICSARAVALQAPCVELVAAGSWEAELSLFGPSKAGCW